jgi:WD40 repeat protein
MRGLAFSPDGKLLAAGDRDGAVILYDVASAKEIMRVDRAHANEQYHGTNCGSSD